MTSYICMNIGCSSFLSIGKYWLLGLEAPHRDLQLQEFCFLFYFILLLWFFLDFFPLFSDERHQQLAVVRHHSLNQIRKTEFSSSPTHQLALFAKFRLPQHCLALRSNKREAKGRWALKPTVKEGDGGKKIKARHYHQLPFFGPPLVERTWLRVKQGNHLSLGAVPHEMAVCTGNLRGDYYKSDACISSEQTIFLQ